MRVRPPSSRIRSDWSRRNRSSCSPARTRKSERSRAASRAISARRSLRWRSMASSLSVVVEIRAHPLPEEHRVVAGEDPLPGPMGKGPDLLVALQLVERGVVGQVQQDDVVEVPTVGDVVPAEEPDPVLLLVPASLPGEEGLHVELEERVAAAADAEVGREHGHGARNLQETGWAAALAAPAAILARRRPAARWVRHLPRWVQRSPPPPPGPRSRRPSASLTRAVGGARRPGGPRPRGGAGRSRSGRRGGAAEGRRSGVSRWPRTAS